MTRFSYFFSICVLLSIVGCDIPDAQISDNTRNESTSSNTNDSSTNRDTSKKPNTVNKEEAGDRNNGSSANHVERYSDDQIQYIGIAYSLMDTKITNSPTGEVGNITRLSGNFSVSSKVDDGIILAHHLDKHGLPDYSVFIIGINTDNIVSDQKFSISQLCLELGTRTYPTVLGGSRTAYSVSIISEDKLKEAIQNIRDEAKAKVILKEMQLSVAKAELEKFILENKNTKDYIEIQELLKMYRPVKNNPNIDKLVKDLEKELERIGHITDLDITKYKSKLTELNKLISEANQELVSATKSMKEVMKDFY